MAGRYTQRWGWARAVGDPYRHNDISAGDSSGRSCASAGSHGRGSVVSILDSSSGRFCQRGLGTDPRGSVAGGSEFPIAH